MATYRMLQPGLAEVQRDDGQSMVLPLDEASAQAQGLQPAGLQLPTAPNPYSMIGSGEAVAGIGGGATDLGTGAGVFAQPSADYGRGVASPQEQVRQDAQALVNRLQTPASTSHPTEAAPSKFDVPLPAGSVGRAAPGLVRVGGGREVPRETGGGGSGEIDPLIAAVMQQGGGGGGPRRMGVTSETRKYHEAGPVDPALAAEIKTGQEQLDQGQSNQLEDAALHRGDYLQQQEALQQEQAQNVQAAMQRRQAVDNEIARLNSKSQQAQDDLANAKPKQVDQFWKDRGVAAQIGAAVAMTLGAWGATIGGTENMGLKVLNQTVDRWMNDQIQQYNVAKDKAELSNNAYKDAIDIYGSPELAQTNLQLQALAAKDALIKTHAEQVGTQDALGQAQLALQESQLQRKMLTAQAQAQAGADVEAKLTLQGGGGGGGDLLSRLKRGAEAKKALNDITGNDPNSAKEDRQRTVRLADGTTGLARDKDSAQKVSDHLDNLHDIKTNLSHLANLAENSNLHTDPDVAGDYDSTAAKTRQLLSNEVGSGNMAAGEMEQILASVPDRNVTNFRSRASGLKSTIRFVDQRAQTAIRSNLSSDRAGKQPLAAPAASSFKEGL